MTYSCRQRSERACSVYKETEKGLTKALPLDPFVRFRDAMLNAKLVFPSESKSRTTGYISLLSAYLSHATSLDDNTTKCLCPGTVNHCDESLDCCTASCFLCSNDSVNASAFPVDAGGGVKPCPRECCVPDRS